MNSTTRYARNVGILVQQVGEQTILLNPNDGQYFALDDIGGQIWELCDGSRTLSEMAMHIVQEFDAPVEVVTSDVHDLLTEFINEKLVDAR